MRKKYLSALLFGALLFASAGTFTSCKDYDDDINNLQSQIDKLATKEDMEAKLSQMQAAIDAAKATAEDAKATAEAAGNADEVKKLEDRIKALEDAAIDVDALKQEISASVDDQMDTFRTEMNALVEKVEGLVGQLADMVTSIELVYSSAAATDVKDLFMMTVTEKDNVFGKGLPGEITFTKGTQRQTGDYVIVRVSPTNAVLTPDMISLINGKGETLDNFLNVDKVEKYNQQILGGVATPQTRADGNTGLWKISVSLKNYDKDSFNAATMEKDGDIYRYIKFAVQVNNTLSTAETREVVSQYDLQIRKTPFKALGKLNYWVDTKNVEDIRNRYATSETDVTTGKPEWTWIGNKADVAAATNSDGSLVTGANANARQATEAEDNRSDEKYIFPAVQGKPFTISLDQVENTSKYADLKSPNEIRAMYVTLDTRNAVESHPSEINAWNSYKYTGLNQVVEGTSTQITIDGANVINDIIGLRVYAVNQDGTLVDPDGRAFYVRLGAAAAEWNAVNTTITPDADITTLPTSEKSTVEAVTLTKLTGAVKAIWSPDKIGGVNSFDAMFVDKDGNVLYNTANNDPSDIDFSKVVKIYTTPKINDWTKYEDDKTYNGKLTIKNANDFVLATLDVSMTKVLPTTMPEGFSVKTAQVKDGIYNCYLVPTSWTGAQTPIANQQGTMDMNHVFNFGKGKESQYEISFAESKTENNKNVTNTVKGDDDLTIAIKYIDNTTKHATSIAYNYGNISSDPEKNNDGKGYKIVATSDKFETIYNCIYNNTYSWRWATREDLGSQYTAKDDKGNYKKAMPYSTSLTYGTDRYADGTNINYGQYIQGISTWDGLYSAKLNEPYNNSLIIKEAHLISNTNKVVDEYFKVVVNSEGQIAQFKATQTSSETNPTAAVESTLQIIGYDMYGHKIVIELPMTVNRR